MIVSIVEHVSQNAQIMLFMRKINLGKYSDGTGLKGSITLPNGSQADADEENTDGGFCEDYYFIVTSKCTECKGFHDEPQCAAVCPVDCCVPDEDNVESEDELLAKRMDAPII